MPAKKPHYPSFDAASFLLQMTCDSSTIESRISGSLVREIAANITAQSIFLMHLETGQPQQNIVELLHAMFKTCKDSDMTNAGIGQLEEHEYNALCKRYLK